ncbi:methylation site containing protein [Vibrio ponticus]|uniref:Methylation site containing protein n=1 Tax=Vibrio ponticus TaxID=265668 RepID=A0ABX3FJY2_9VIBR|nr:type II secretion system protein [Vibrio ponticus]OLQ94403.1 methylation site containing protein [Vibrio ponticus]
MKNNKNSGFTLIELVVVIVILALLAVVALPRFTSFTREAHEARADGAFSSFASAVQLFHSKWLTQGEPEPTETVDYGNNDIHPSITGYPISVGDNQPPTDSDYPVNGEDCVDLWHALTNNDLTIRSLSGTGVILPSDTDIVSWYRGKHECTYYYTSGFAEDEHMPSMFYSPITGDITFGRTRNNTPTAP